MTGCKDGTPWTLRSDLPSKYHNAMDPVAIQSDEGAKNDIKYVPTHPDRTREVVVNLMFSLHTRKSSVIKLKRSNPMQVFAVKIRCGAGVGGGELLAVMVE